MNNRCSTVHYSVGGMPQYFNSPVDVIRYGVTEDINTIVINTSVQPNSIPHFGTITTFMGAFILAQQTQDAFRRPSFVEIDYVDCGPTAHYHRYGGAICRSIAKTPSDNDPSISIADYYINNYYTKLLDWISNKSGIAYRIRRYKEFQKSPIIRKAIIEICHNNQIVNLLSPNEHKLHIRSECSICGNIDKHLDFTTIDLIDSETIAINSNCSIHGAYRTIITENNSEYLEINTQLRDIAKGRLMSSYREAGILGIMYDGGDWGGAWTHNVHCKALELIKCPIPIRLFAPLILDWSGGKLSKSIYCVDDNYAIDALEDYTCFVNRYGEAGLDVIFEEVTSWILSSKRFFRNYSLEYILEVLKKVEYRQ